MKKIALPIISILLFIPFFSLGQNSTCINSVPICTGPTYTYPAGTTGLAEPGANYGCLVTQPAPAWFHMRIEDPGDITIYIYATPLVDIDFICWGPFTNPTQPCVQGLTSGKIVSCSYSPNPTEFCVIPNGQTGEYYILMITNYSQQPASITFSQTAGTGSLDCDITNDLEADFTATPLYGDAPLTVQFTDESLGGPTAWIWDFQNDGINDTTIQNPYFTYEVAGQYSVRLIVIKSTLTDTIVRENYITVNQSLPAQGLIAYYPFSGNAEDESGSGNDGTTYGVSLTADRFGNPNSAYYFDGNDYIECMFAPFTEDVDFSWSFWINRDVQKEGLPFIGPNVGYTAVPGNTHNLNAGTLSDQPVLQTSGIAALIGNDSIFAGNWYHLAVVKEGQSLDTNTVSMYVNGVEINWLSQQSTPSLFPLNNTFYMGIQKGPDTVSYSRGILDDIRIYDLALSQEEVLELYHENLMTTPGICIATVTPEDNNRVIWEKVPSEFIDSYRVYKENHQTNSYELIGTVSYADSSIFLDMTADPQQRFDSYKVSAVSTFGVESGLSTYHRTMFLDIGHGQYGWSLAWSPYIGFAFDAYYIYRGFNSGSLVLLDSVSSDLTFYNDIDPPFAPLYYAIEVRREGGCEPLKESGYDRSRSNIRNTEYVGMGEDYPAGIAIFPNPAHDRLFVQFPGDKQIEEGSIGIFDMQGKQLLSRQLAPGRNVIGISRFQQGLYIIRLSYDHGMLTKKLVVY